GVHCLVGHEVDLPFGIASHQVGTYLFHFLGNEAEVRGAFAAELRLVAEGDRTQREDRLTSSVHVRDVLLVAARGTFGSQLAAGADSDVSADVGGGVVNGLDNVRGAAEPA